MRGVRAHEALRLVELEHLASRRPNQLSGGQQQRVALARAVVNRPALLLLDEPLGALDLKLRRQMQLELKDIQHDVGLTFLHVTHDQEEAMTMADTVAVMNKGRIEQMGAPEELYELPTTAFVANFLGQSNLFTGEVISSGSDSIVVDIAGPQDRGAARARPAPRRRGHDRRPPREADAAHERAGRRIRGQPRRPGPGQRRLVQRGQHAVPDRRARARQHRAVRAEHRRSARSSTTAPRSGSAGRSSTASASPTSRARPNRFDPDDDTREIAMIQRKRLEAELEEG